MTRLSVNNNARMGLVVSLCSNSNHLISLIPPNCLKFGHLLSCDTIVDVLKQVPFSITEFTQKLLYLQKG